VVNDLPTVVNDLPSVKHDIGYAQFF